MDMFKKLYNAARPLCLPTYTPDNRHKASSQDIQLASVVEKVDKQLQSTNEKFASIDSKLSQLTQSIASYGSSPPPNAPTSYPTSDSIIKNIEPVSHNCSHIEKHKSCNDFINPSVCDKLQDLFEHEEFVKENGREVAQYGVKYNYMGANAKVNTEIPEALDEIMNTINQSLTGGRYELNSILVNRYKGKNSFLPEHADDEYAINPESDIFTVSVGSTRTVLFRDTITGEEHEHPTPSGSLYCMTRQSQDVYRHRIEKDDSFDEKLRYSITLRCVHYKYLNSTCVMGDSNTANFKFGEDRGTFGRTTPGKRVETLHIQDIDPQRCMAYRNVVLMVGTNNLKSKHIKNTADTRALFDSFSHKIKEIRQLNKRCRVFIVPVIPTRYININHKVVDFNNIASRELPRMFPKLFIVRGIGELVDRSNGGTLATRFRRNPDPSGLHINNIGVSLVVGCIKSSIVQAKSRNQGTGSKVSNTPYSAVAGTSGASSPVTPRRRHDS